MNSYKLILVIIFFLVSGCSTPEYRAQRDACSGEGYANYPVKMEQRVREGTKEITVADGSDCNTSVYNGKVICKTRYKTEYIPYTYVVNVDVNKSARNSLIRECAKSNCLSIYGNTKCE